MKNEDPRELYEYTNQLQFTFCLGDCTNSIDVGTPTSSIEYDFSLARKLKFGLNYITMENSMVLEYSC